MFEEERIFQVKDLGFCATWPEELKELSRRHYRAACRVRNLENAVGRVDPTGFDSVMDQLEAAREELCTIGTMFWKAKWAWETKGIMPEAELHAGGEAQR